MHSSTPQRFELVRDTDVTGISGAGHIADGIRWPDGTCALRWRTRTASTAVYDSLTDIDTIHGHDGATRIVFTDPATPGDPHPPLPKRRPAPAASQGHTRRYGALYILLVLFFASWLGQAIAQFNAGDSWTQFWASTFENWQSEWLQLVFQGVFLLAAKHVLFAADSTDQERMEDKLDLLLDRTGPDGR